MKLTVKYLRSIQHIESNDVLRAHIRQFRNMLPDTLYAALRVNGQMWDSQGQNWIEVVAPSDVTVEQMPSNKRYDNGGFQVSLIGHPDIVQPMVSEFILALELIDVVVTSKTEPRQIVGSVMVRVYINARKAKGNE